jgi:hypothetical protein
VALGSLAHAPGLAVGTTPDWNAMTPSPAQTSPVKE